METLIFQTFKGSLLCSQLLNLATMLLWLSLLPARMKKRHYGVYNTSPIVNILNAKKSAPGKDMNINEKNGNVKV